MDYFSVLETEILNFMFYCVEADNTNIPYIANLLSAICLKAVPSPIIWLAINSPELNQCWLLQKVDNTIKSQYYYWH